MKQIYAKYNNQFHGIAWTTANQSFVLQLLVMQII